MAQGEVGGQGSEVVHFIDQVHPVSHILGKARPGLGQWGRRELGLQMLLGFLQQSTGRRGPERLPRPRQASLPCEVGGVHSEPGLDGQAGGDGDRRPHSHPPLAGLGARAPACVPLWDREVPGLQRPRQSHFSRRAAGPPLLAQKLLEHLGDPSAPNGEKHL